MSAAPHIVSTAVLSGLLDVSPRWVQKLADDGVFRSESKGKWNATECVPAFLRHRVAQEVAKVASKAGGAAEQFVQAKSKAVEMRTAREDGSLIELAEAVEIVDEVIGTTKAGFGGLPARLTRDAAERAAMETAIADIWDDVTVRFRRRLAQVRGTTEKAGR